jgi:hypothetical protein
VCWVQEFFIAEDRVRIRGPKDMPPSRDRIESPYDANTPHLITHIATTEATVTDAEMTETIHVALDQAGLLAAEHIVDRGYVNATPIREDITWRGKADEGLAIEGFLIDWDAHTAICPATGSPTCSGADPQK